MSTMANTKVAPLWIDRLEPPATPSNPLEADIDVDIAIIGGGYSGLWTAYYLMQTDPALRVAIIESTYCGFGASGRNGGWVVGELAGSFRKYAELSSESESLRQMRAVFDAVDEVGAVAAAERIDCDYAKGGVIRVARTTPQARRQLAEIEQVREIGLTEDEMRLLSVDQAREYLNATNIRSGIFFGPGAAVDPAKLARGLFDVVRRLGVHVYEGSPVTKIDGRIITANGHQVKADSIVQATEAYTRNLPGQKRDLLPVYSLMIATEPLSDETIAEIGLADRPTFADDRFMVIYGQRTADNRIAFGGRGVPYLYGSRISAATEGHTASHHYIQRTLAELLPPLKDTAITHRWGGVLAIPRNWTPGLRFDVAEGRGVLGGYVGEGVAASNLAGRTMADLIVGDETDRTSLPWVGVSSRKWEPEPFRWLGVRASRALLSAADDREELTDKEGKLAFKLASWLRDY